MKPPLRLVLLRLLTVLALAATAWVGILSLQLLVQGQGVSLATEIAIEDLQQGRPVAQAIVDFYEPYPFAGLYVLETSLVLTGLLVWRLTWLAWLGAGMLLITSGLLLFSSGAAFLPAAGLLLVLLAGITYLRAPTRIRP